MATQSLGGVPGLCFFLRLFQDVRIFSANKVVDNLSDGIPRNHVERFGWSWWKTMKPMLLGPVELPIQGGFTKGLTVKTC